MTLLKDELRTVAALDYDKGLVYMVNDKLYLKALHSFMDVLNGWLEKRLGRLSDGDPSRFVIDVHALKSNARSVGADALSAKAAELEKKGRENDMDAVLQGLPALLEDIAQLQSGLAAALKTDSADGGFSGTRTDERAKELTVSELSVALCDFDADAALEKLNELKTFRLNEFEKKTVEQIINAVDQFEYDGAAELVARLNGAIQ